MAHIFVQSVKSKMYVIGLTGGIATGKSTVVKWWSKQKVPVIDADILAREVVEPKSPVLEKIIETFGEKFLLANGTLNRKLLGKLVFNDDKARERLDLIMQPPIRKKIEKKLMFYNEQGENLIVLDMPLLIEKNYLDLVDTVWLVWSKKQIQLDRLMKRDSLTKEEALVRINSQMPFAEKKKYANVLIDNNKSIEQLEEQLIIYYQKLCKGEGRI